MDISIVFMGYITSFLQTQSAFHSNEANLDFGLLAEQRRKIGDCRTIEVELYAHLTLPIELSRL